MTEEQKQFAVNKLNNWANTNKMIAMQKSELSQLHAICRETEAAKSFMPDCKTEKACQNVIEICKERIDKIDGIIKKYTDEKLLMDGIIDSLDYTEQIIVRQRYQHSRGWDYITAYLPVPLSIRQCHRIHNEIIEKIYSCLAADRTDSV